MNYEKDLKIDKDRLDEEWFKHPIIGMKYVKLAAEADSEARRAKEAISVIGAQVSTMIRTEREKQNLKTTEAMLSGLVFQNDQYRDAVNDHIDKLEEAKIMNGAVDAFAQRKHALENAVKLFLAGYFSAPKDIKEDDEDIGQDKKAVDKAGKKQKAGLKRKKK